MKRALLAGAVVVAACSSASIRGGSAQGARRELSGTTLARYQERECVDSSRAPVARSATVVLTKQKDGRLLLAETAPARDTVVAEQHFSEGGEDVYQVVLEPSSGSAVLSDFRIPQDRAREGRMTLSERWSERELPDGGFRATATGAAVSCRLVPEGADGGAP
ncbi:MAG: hypothetical protein KC776_25170 [Myxococcales bacterium]|nr:hypothetical protein [Myxococcales bacterium]MCB9578046.1 hypothetical protein [Polyangiaceae bacterium]